MIEKLQEIVRRYTDNDEIIIHDNMVLLTDLGLNSYELVELVCKVEDEFDVEISDRTISGLKTVQNILECITAHA